MSFVTILQLVYLLLGLISCVRCAQVGTRWALLVAGSKGYVNYRHQADVCHAYQMLTDKGIPPDNIVVFMYDDIAYHPENPHKGVIINYPNGFNVYEGVPKDYTGIYANANNLQAVLMGRKDLVYGGSGKVIASGPDDTIFIYYAGHGARNFIGMPTGPYIKAETLLAWLKAKFKSDSYYHMLVYIESCKSGSMFACPGVLERMNIYATTASRAYQNSYSCYCYLRGEYSKICLGDLDSSDITDETVGEQYARVKARTIRSDVMEFGTKALKLDFLSEYMGPEYGPPKRHSTKVKKMYKSSHSHLFDSCRRDMDIIYMMEKVNETLRVEDRLVVEKELDDVLSHRRHVDQSVKSLLKSFAGNRDLHLVLTEAELLGDLWQWECIEPMMDVFQEKCGSLTDYGQLEYTRAFAYLCSIGIERFKVAQAAQDICKNTLNAKWKVEPMMTFFNFNASMYL